MELILPELGFIALLLACGISAATAWLALAGYRSRWTNLSRLASTLTLVQFGLLLLAFGLLILAFLTDDFTLVYVSMVIASFPLASSSPPSGAGMKGRYYCGCCAYPAGAPCSPGAIATPLTRFLR